MWISLMTSGVKMRDCPRMYLRLSAGARDKGATGEAWPCFFFAIFVALSFLGISLPLQHQLLLARLEIVVVPQLLAGDNLAEVLEAARRPHVVDSELADEPVE